MPLELVKPGGDPDADLSPEDLRTIQGSDFYLRQSPLVCRLAVACLELRAALKSKLEGNAFEDLRRAQQRLEQVNRETTDKVLSLRKIDQEKADLASQVLQLRETVEQQWRENQALRRSLNTSEKAADKERAAALAGSDVKEVKRLLRKALRTL